jgi:hypothetical protein
MSLQKPKIEVRHAWEWTCEDCGRNNFVSAVVAEMAPEDRFQFAKDNGIIDEFANEAPDDIMDGDFMTFPTEVECEHCGAEFETEHDGDKFDGESTSDEI